MLKMALLKCANSDNCCSIHPAHPFSSPLLGLWQLKCPCPQEFAIQGKKSAYAWGGGDWAQLELTDASNSILPPFSHDT